MPVVEGTSTRRGNTWDEQVARTIVDIGRQRGLGEREIVAALATGLVESGLRNVKHGDRDSLGVFQQRPSQGWGTPEQVMDVAYAAGKFYDAIPQFDEKGISGAELAARVQRPAKQYRGRYAQKWAEAQNIYAQLTGGTPNASTTSALAEHPELGQAAAQSGKVDFRTILATIADRIAGGQREDQPGIAPGQVRVETTLSPLPPGVDDGTGFQRIRGAKRGREALDLVNEMLAGYRPDPAAPAPQGDVPVEAAGTAPTTTAVAPAAAPSDNAKAFIQAASQFIGTPYVWGGASQKGVDCSGLLLLAARSIGVNLPRVSRDQARTGTDAGMDPNAWKPGDLIAFDAGKDKGVVNHIGILIGKDDQGRWQMLHAPRAGKDVEVVPMTRSDILAVRRIA